MLTESSLPLMGIGNFGDLAIPMRRQRLSLPLMGIGNLRLPVAQGGLHQSHYPSWGLGTFSLGKRNQGGYGSLPLMGIGNPHYYLFSSDAIWRSLPLMGIGNLA